MTRLFGTDGVRGIVGEWPLVPEFALKLGRAAGTIFSANGQRPTIIIGRDTRQSGPMLQSALAAGLLAAGADVLDLGVITTPGVSWLVRRLGAAAGAAISASHNPVAQNGIKFFNSDGLKLSEDIETEIEQLADPQPDERPAQSLSRSRVRSDDFSHQRQRATEAAATSRFRDLLSLAVETSGRVIDGRGMRELYSENLLAEHPALRLDRLTILIDCANGAASEYAPELFARVGARAIAIHASPTGLNINVEAGSEFVRQHPERTEAMLHTYHADFGVAFDGDADRVIFVDRRGGVVDGDHMLGMLANYLDKHDRLLARSVVTTTMRNAGLKSYLEKAGLQLHETPVGDKYVTEKLLELRRQPSANSKQVGLGGEQSGHVILLDDEHVTGDGVRTALFVMRAFLESGAKTMAEFAAGIGKTPQIIASAEVGRGARMEKAALADLEKQTLADTPGLSRINLRYSGTETKFRAMLESDGRKSEEELAAIAVTICRQMQAMAGMNGAEIEIQDCSRGGLIPVNGLNG